MSDRVSFGVTVLWASELRAASQALHDAFATMKAQPFNEAQMQTACKEALRAAYVALQGVFEDPDRPLVVMEADRQRFVVRDAVLIKPENT